MGYKKPPRKHQWKKGQSGNPGGREQGHKGLKTDLAATLDRVETIESKMTGRKSKARNQLHAVERLVERATLGDLKAIAILMPLVMNVLGIEDRNKGPKRLNAQDAAILAELLGADFDEVEGVTPLLTDGREAGAIADNDGLDDGLDDEGEDGENDDAA